MATYFWNYHEGIKERYFGIRKVTLRHMKVYGDIERMYRDFYGCLVFIDVLRDM